MTDTEAELERLVLISVADDYEEFNTIAELVVEAMEKTLGTPSLDEIELALMKAISAQNTAAYSLSVRQPYVTPVEVSRNTLIDLYWFYITEKGKVRLDHLRRS